jgi:tetratricopeptide (TPR) repeat protein
MQPMSRKFLLALPVSLLFSSICFAQTAAIQGDVKGEDGKPLVGAAVKIERTDIKQSFATKTDKKGHYFYGGLGIAGTFNISIEVAGKLVDQVNGVKPQGGVPQEVNFDLKAAAAKAAAAAAAAGPGAAPVDVERGMTPAQKAEYEKKKKEAEATLAKNKELNDAFNAGMEAETAKKFDIAVQQFQKASEIGPTQHVVWSHLADNYSSLSDSETGDAKKADLDKAAADYQKALELDPQDAAYHNNYALILVKERKIDDAQTELGKAATLDPTSAGKYYYNLGAVMANINQNDAAAEAFKKAMAANYVEAYYQYGLTLVSKATTTPDGKIVAPDGTIQAFQKYLELAPTGPNAQPAKDMLATLGAGIQTSFDKPGAKPATKKGK